MEDRRHSTVIHAADRLQKALEFLKREDWPDAVHAALAAEKRARSAKREETKRAWLTAANLIIVAAQDEQPFLQDAAPPAAPSDPDDEGIPF